MRPDARTVIVELARPMPHLATVLALPFAGPLHAPPLAIDGTITNGPYRVLARRPGENIELVRNHRFHAADAVAVERVTYLTLDDLNTELNLYRSGDLDVTSEVPNSQLDWLRKNLPGQLRVAPYLSTYAYVPNQRRLARSGRAQGAGDGGRSPADHHAGDRRRRDCSLRAGFRRAFRATRRHVSTGATQPPKPDRSRRKHSGWQPQNAAQRQPT